MAITKFAQDYHEKMFPGYVSKFLTTDPEFIERFDNFAFDEVLHMPLSEGQQPISDVTRYMAILAVLLGCQGIDEFKAMVPAAMEFGVTPVQIKEIVYQAVAYLGIGRVFPFLKAVNEIFEEKGIALPLPPQSTTDADAEDDGVNERLLSQSTLQKLREGKPVSWENIEAFCRMLEMQPGDLLEYKSDTSENE